MSGRRVGVGHPELGELVSLLEQHGVENGGTVEIVEALTVGAEPYVQALADDPTGGTWKRFREASDVLRGVAAGEISPDSITIGSLVWALLRGAKFTQAVADRMRTTDPPTTFLH